MNEKKEILAADQNPIPALHIRRGGKRLMVASHGIDSEKTESGLYLRFAELLPKDYDLLLFDFRGSGDSSLDSMGMTVAGALLDLMAVFNWAREQKYSTLEHIATSFGASITLLAASVYDLSFLRKAVFWNPVISYQNTFIQGMPEWGRTFFNQRRTDELSRRPYTKITDSEFKISPLLTQELLLLNPEKVAWPKTIPLLIVHGSNDTLVPVSDAQDYGQRNGVRVEVLSGVDHGFDHKEREAIDLTISWLTE
ncbi:alpha/beta hydrolase [Bradyrhizobium sp. 14AA]